MSKLGVIAKRYNASIMEAITYKDVSEGNIVCFYHGDDYLGRGVVLRMVNHEVTIELDSVAQVNYARYSHHYNFLDFMVLDEEVEMIFDEY